MATPSLHIGATQTAPKMPEIPQETPMKAGEKGGGFMSALNEFVAKYQSIKTADKVAFFRLLATMINAGISIVKALRILMDQTENGHMKLIIKEIVERIESGSSFSQALAEFPKYFTEAQIGMVEAGEASGRMNQTLLQIAIESEKQAAFSPASKEP
jgi:type IV pilus assembly protein PilC